MLRRQPSNEFEREKEQDQFSLIQCHYCVYSAGLSPPSKYRSTSQKQANWTNVIITVIQQLLGRFAILQTFKCFFMFLLMSINYFSSYQLIFNSFQASTKQILKMREKNQQTNFSKARKQLGSNQLYSIYSQISLGNKDKGICMKMNHWSWKVSSDPFTVDLFFINSKKQTIVIMVQTKKNHQVVFGMIEMSKFNQMLKKNTFLYQVKIATRKFEAKLNEQQYEAVMPTVNQNSLPILSFHQNNDKLMYQSLKSSNELESFLEKNLSKTNHFTLLLKTHPQMLLVNQTLQRQNRNREKSIQFSQNKGQKNETQCLINDEKMDTDSWIVKIKIKYQESDRRMHGKGILISSRLVLTNAHLIQPTKFKNLANIEIQSDGQFIKVEDLRYPPQFTQNKKHRNNNNYILLYLSRPIIKKKYLKIAYGFHDRKENIFKNFKILFKDQTNEKIYDQTKSILYLDFNSNQGDSGTPIFAHWSNEQSYIIATHIGLTERNKKQQQKIQNNKKQLEKKKCTYGLKLKSQVINNILAYAKEMTHDTTIFESSITSFDSIINEKSQQILKEGSLSISCFLQRVTLYLLQLQENLIGQQQLQQKNNDKRKSLLHNQTKYFLKKFRDQWVSLVNKQIQEVILPSLSNFLNSIQTQSKSRKLWISYVNCLKDIISVFAHNLGDDSNKWLSKIINQKLLIWEEQHLAELFLLSKKERMSSISITTENQHFGLDAIYFGYSPLLKSSHYQLVFLKDNVCCPFQSLTCKGHYLIRGFPYYQYQYKVVMEDEHQCEEEIWHKIGLNNSVIPLLLSIKEIPTETIQETEIKKEKDIEKIVETETITETKIETEKDKKKQKTIMLKTIFRSFNSKFLLKDFLRDCQSDIVLKLIRKIIEAVAKLHSDKIYICSPIQYSLLIDPQQIQEITLFNLQSPKSLYSFIKKQKQFNCKDLSSCYPVSEIIQNEGRPDHCEEIDCWMLSLSFQKIIMKVNKNQRKKEKQLMDRLLILMKQMRFQPPIRLTVIQLQNILDKMLPLTIVL